MEHAGYFWAFFTSLRSTAASMSMPVTAAFGRAGWVAAEWRQVDKVDCDRNDTMGNLGRPISEEEIYDAMRAANSLAERDHD